MRLARRLAPLLLAALMVLALAPLATAAERARPRQVSEADYRTATSGLPVTEPSAGRDLAAGCDPIDPAVCMFPFPNDHFTAPDAGSATGRRIAFRELGMPRNGQGSGGAGNPIRPAEWNRSDGFSPGQPIVVKVPGLDSLAAHAATGAVPVTDVARTYDADQPVVVLNATTGARQLIFSEVDTNPAAPADRTLIIRPAENFAEGQRYIVALRRMRRADGTIIPASAAFAAYRTGTATDARRPHMEGLFARLTAAGIGRGDLYLAWDFTVASAQSTTGRMLAIRDDAFAELGDADLADEFIAGSAPPFTVNTVTDYTVAQDARIARRVQGTVTVPCYLTSCPQTGPTTFNYPVGVDPDRTPVQVPGQTAAATFTCDIPRTALTTPARPTLYGHGLFGGQGEVGAGNVKDMAAEHNRMHCGVDWFGMATADVPNALLALEDLSNFPALIDRVQQGFLHFLYVGRAMVHPQGFVTNAAFRSGGQPLIDITELYYDGNSQGGIYGGSLTAVAPDFTRAVLGVPGMNYSTLLRRSVDFVGEGPTSYSTALYTSYPNELERPLVLSIVQMLWDRGDPNGYAQHMTRDPLPNTPRHEILLQVAFGDHQVANLTAEVEARTIGGVILQPALDPGRHSDVDPYAFLPDFTGQRHEGSALVLFDIGPIRTENGQQRGTATPPTTITPPTAGRDPHGAPRGDRCGRVQKAAFLAPDGAVVDTCGPGPYYADGYRGPVAAAEPDPVVPETPAGALLPLLATLLLGAALKARQRRTAAA